MKITFKEEITHNRRNETKTIKTATEIWEEMRKLPCDYVANIDIHMIEEWLQLNLLADKHQILKHHHH